MILQEARFAPTMQRFRDRTRRDRALAILGERRRINPAITTRTSATCWHRRSLWDRNSEKPDGGARPHLQQKRASRDHRKRDWFGILRQCEVRGRNLDLGELMEPRVENPNDVQR